MRRQIVIEGPAGDNILRFIEVDPGEWFGGCTSDEVSRAFPFVVGPHIWYRTEGILDLIAEIARRSNCLYTLVGDAARLPISRVMRADQIAVIVGCKRQEIVEYFRNVVEVGGE